MRKQFRITFKAYFRSELLKARNALGLTQEEMAHTLSMSTRAYAALEGGKSCCALITFLLFMRRCCSDRHAFIDGLLRIFEHLEKDVA